MRFIETDIPGAFIIELEPRADSRGFFARTFCVREFAEHGLITTVAQCNMSYNHQRGTLRGLHYQSEPAPEAKLVRCVSGAIYEVIVEDRKSTRLNSSHVK